MSVDSSSDDEIDMEQLEGLLEETNNNDDVVEDHVLNEPRLDSLNLKNVHDMINNLPSGQIKNLISKLAENNNLNESEENFIQMSKGNHARLRLAKLYQKKQAEKNNQEGKEDDVSSKTMKNRKHHERKKRKKQLQKQKKNDT